MMRRTPMKRTPFKSKAPAMPVYERAPRVLQKVDPSRFRLPVPITGVAEPIEKAEYVRSKKLREAYRLIPCQACNADDGTVVCAHANEGIFGKGMAIKASDDRAASLCFTCHGRLDQGSDMTRDERRAFWLAAHIKTIAALVAAGHWPADIPIPSTNTAPMNQNTQ